MSTTFQHKGVSITLLSSGRFAAIINGVEVRTGSLAGMEKKIDTPPEFTPFASLYTRYSDEKPSVVMVTGRRSTRRKYSNHSHVWVLANGNEADSVIEDTPENRKALAAWRKLVRDNNKKRDALRTAESAARALITTRNATP
jgi:hypothetical protein